MKIRKNLQVIFVSLLALSMFATTVPAAKVGEIIYIRADGSVDPPHPHISTSDMITYTLTGDIDKPIIVERDNIVIDGAGYTLQGTGVDSGITLSGRFNVTIQSLNVDQFEVGILLEYCSHNLIVKNNITANTYVGITVFHAFNNSITRNNIIANGEYGIKICDSVENRIFHNNFVDNNQQAFSCCDSLNFWDAGYPRGGNYWNDHVGTDDFRGVNQDVPGIDGIGDSPYPIDNEKDNYPLMGPFSPRIMIGLRIAVFPDPEVGLIFDEVTATGSTTVSKTTTGPPPPQGLIGSYYDIVVTATFSGEVMVRIIYGDSELTPEQETGLNLVQYDFLLGDINLDGKVNFKDIFTVLRAWRSTPGHSRWNPSCDLNRDKEINMGDLEIALRNYGKRSEWIDITTYVDVDSNIIYGKADHFSFFAIR